MEGGKSEIETVIFKKSEYSLPEAKAWLKKHKLNVSQLVEKEDTYHFRQKNPKDFDRFRTKKVDGISFIFGFKGGCDCQGGYGGDAPPQEGGASICIPASPSEMKTKGIYNHRDFLRWALRGGHPDKGGNSEVFQRVQCADELGIYAGNAPEPEPQPVPETAFEQAPEAELNRLADAGKAGLIALAIGGTIYAGKKLYDYIKKKLKERKEQKGGAVRHDRSIIRKPKILPVKDIEKMQEGGGDMQDGEGVLKDISLAAFQKVANLLRKKIPGARPLKLGELHVLGANFLGQLGPCDRVNAVASF